MPPSRRPPPVEIYQDEPDPSQPFSSQPCLPSHAQSRTGMRPPPQLAPSALPLQGVQNPPTTAHMAPPGMIVGAPNHPGLSPAKNAFYGPPHANGPMMHHMMSGVSGPPMQPGITRSPLDDSFNVPFFGPPALRHLPPQPMYSMWNLNASIPGQESMHNSAIMPETAPFPIPQSRKRSASDASAHGDKRNKKQKNEADTHLVLPAPHEMPPVEDPGDKPSYSYAMMIGMAILRSPSRQLTLSGIYGWIQDTFAYYRNQELGAGWQNSIRHNLSLSKAFKKRPRPKEDTGKGCYWYITEGEEMQFMTQRTRKGAANGNMILQHEVMGQQTMQVMAPVPQDALQAQQWVPPVMTQMPPPLQRSQTAPAPIQLLPALAAEQPPEILTPTHPPLPSLDVDDGNDSDATIPASDTILDEANAPFGTDFLTMPDLTAADETDDNTVSRQGQQVIGSSPPVTMVNHRPQSSPAEFLPPIPPARGVRRRYPLPLNDSGYHSDLQSSARKHKVPQSSLASATPRAEKNARNRRPDRDFSAQAEIVRMRSSPSYQSHVHLRAASDVVLPTTPACVSSILKRGPNTPVLLGDPTIQLLASVSPTRQLHSFRHQFQESPSRNTFNFPNTLSNISPTGEVEDFFGNAIYAHEVGNGTPHLSSPFKPPHSIKRPGMFRSNTTTGVLSDVTRNARNRQNARTPSRAPILKPSAPSIPASFVSPTKSALAVPSHAVIEYESEEENFDIAVFFDADGHDENEAPGGKNENEAAESSDGYDLADGFPMIAGKGNDDNDDVDVDITSKPRPRATRHGMRRYGSALTQPTVRPC